MFTEIHIIGVVNKFIVIMKELSIEEKAKAYDGNYKTYTELINRLEDVKEAIKKQNYGIAMDMLYKPYPAFQITTSNELKESENDKIKKDIIQCVKYSGDNFIPFYKSTVGDMISYLEKQGEQKPAWSEEDGAMLDNIVAWIEGKWGTLGGKVGGREAYISFLKSLKNRVQPQPKQEWSEEDETILNNLIWALKEDMVLANDRDEYVNWLKSLKPQSQWKPSDEQMEALLYEVNAWDEDSINGQNLKSLYQDLKNLREE